MYNLIFVRHGKSIWNIENRFTGWTDIGLSEIGRQQAESAAQILQHYLLENQLEIKKTYSSILKRCVETLWIMLEKMDMMHLSIQTDYRLNERHYGALQGLNKEEAAKIFGKEQVYSWRRSFSIQPPSLEESDPKHPKNDPKYSGHCYLPGTESLKDTLERFIEYWGSIGKDELKVHKNILVCSHGNLIRAAIKYFEDISDNDIVQINVNNTEPVIYQFNNKLEMVNKKVVLVPDI